jgi:osmotically-inducible protein OsmY
MTSGYLLVALIALGSLGCRADTSAEQREIPAETRITASHTPLNDSRAVARVPSSPADRTIRRELNGAIGGDPDLKDREISFIVNNGDINVTGTVRTEAERQKINHLALAIPGVRSVANAVRVSS